MAPIASPFAVLLFALWLAVALTRPAHAADAPELSGRIIKVLPHFLDLKGRQSLSPSLYERDAYQAQLRRNPDQCSGMRFDVQWKAKNARKSDLRLRLEMVTKENTKDRPLVVEQPVRAPGGRSRWAQVFYTGEDYRRSGAVIAWRVSLWDGRHLLAEQQSFLW